MGSPSFISEKADRPMLHPRGSAFGEFPNSRKVLKTFACAPGRPIASSLFHSRLPFPHFHHQPLPLRQFYTMPTTVSGPRTLYDKIWDDHVVYVAICGEGLSIGRGANGLTFPYRPPVISKKMEQLCYTSTGKAELKARQHEWIC